MRNAECGVRNAEFEWEVVRGTTLIPRFRIPNSAFRIDQAGSPFLITSSMTSPNRSISATVV